MWCWIRDIEAIIISTVWGTCCKGALMKFIIYFAITISKFCSRIIWKYVICWASTSSSTCSISSTCFVFIVCARSCSRTDSLSDRLTKLCFSWWCIDISSSSSKINSCAICSCWIKSSTFSIWKGTTKYSIITISLVLWAWNILTCCCSTIGACSGFTKYFFCFVCYS